MEDVVLKSIICWNLFCVFAGSASCMKDLADVPAWLMQPNNERLNLETFDTLREAQVLRE